MTLDVAALKRRSAVLKVVNLASLAVAGAGAVGYFRFGLDWALFLFIGALAIGFAAQIWFIIGLRGPGKGA